MVTLPDQAERRRRTPLPLADQKENSSGRRRGRGMKELCLDDSHKNQVEGEKAREEGKG